MRREPGGGEARQKECSCAGDKKMVFGQCISSSDSVSASRLIRRCQKNAHFSFDVLSNERAKTATAVSCSTNLANFQSARSCIITGVIPVTGAASALW